MIKCVTNELLKDSLYSHHNVYKKINHYLYNKYSNKNFSYNSICIYNLICNDYCHIVARFKDFLIYDDDSEFLNEFCNKKNLKSKLKYIFSFYSSYIHVYPNYLVIPEKKFLYKNLRKKQKMINENNEVKLRNRENKLYKKNNMTYHNGKNIYISLCEKIFNEKNYMSSDINKNINIKKCFFNSRSHSFIKKSKIIYSSFNSNNHYTERNYLNQNLKIYLNQNKIDNNQNTQYSSISNFYYNDESKKSRASLTEIINLLSCSDKQRINRDNSAENNTRNKIKKPAYKLTKNNKNRIKFFRLGNTDYINKVFKTHKIKSNFNKVEIERSSSIKNESKINNKNNYIKNYKHKSNLKKINENLFIHKQTISCMDDISKFFRNKSKNKQTKRKSSICKFKNSNIEKANGKKYFQNLILKTLPNFSRKNKLNDIKNNLKKNIKNLFSKKNDKSKYINNLNNFIISTNTTINFENKNKINAYRKKNENHRNFNTAKNLMKKNINFKLFKSIDNFGYSIEQIKSKKEKYLTKKVKLDSDSILSTQVSINKKYRHNSTCTENILSQIRNSVMKKNYTTNNNKKNKNTMNFSRQYTNYLRTKQLNLNAKINSYAVKPFSPHFQKISNISIKNGKQKENNSTLIKNKIIFNFFDSKDFYNLRINPIKHKKSKYYEEKKSNSTIKNKDKNNKSTSLFLKSFNKGYIHLNGLEINKFKHKNLKLNYRNNNCGNNRKDNCFYGHISCDKIENNNNISNKTHKKNKTTNICKILEEIGKKIEQRNKIKYKENTQNKRHILNLLKANKNRNFIQYKISSETLTKSLKIKIDNKIKKNIIKN